mmetsp:Transcript_38634/g.70803  ORF Transcript_38634/g.70803 Transcript_38634/m.70803 type:complete len:455 (+) Transcript_38634:130-1494(+)|eukprot:CAMPEP_0171835392 /NCGR_PEP_ID=MMETSP0992-20121227/10970_1 /TAXON_ID=483369 /ORGANISM="non described non described, Strain CCMP2098" /LENGTH=454 /DNA_ID=CAMNT_0012451235 /DNA_START=129 /DNA_END=1493 /DNA_ORIENTATION=-
MSGGLAKAAEAQQQKKVESANSESIKMLAFLGRGTNEALLRSVASCLKPTLSIKPYRGETDVAPEVLRKSPWCDLVFLGSWKGYEEVFAASKWSRYVNRIPRFFELCDKSILCDILTKAHAVSAPDCLVLPRDVSYVKNWASKGHSLILKPSDGAKGDCIRVVPPGDGQEAAVLRAIAGRPVETNNKTFVLQQYISAPLLLHKRKFDLRLYVAFVFDESSTLDTLDSPARSSPTGTAFLCRHGLARLCSQPYEPPNDENCAHARVHLTNFAVNKGAGKQESGAVPLKMSAASALSELARTSRKRGGTGAAAGALTPEKLWSGIHHTSYEVATAVLPFLQKAVTDHWATGGREVTPGVPTPQDHFARRRRFQVAGLDIMLDSDGAPKVLELNANPSLSIHGENGISIEAVDEAVKVPMLVDLLKLAVLRDDTVNPLSKMLPEACNGLCWNFLCAV